MKKLIIVMLTALVVACGGYINVKTYEMANSVCKDYGGLFTIYVGDANELTAFCKDSNKSFTFRKLKS